ncbi:uncharacterized protein MEPE_01096 [Melanopsichium pennsylvanicum]|uniref:Uncharacterized protein n=2 Tax=Melanopsichium pennsylvanicum TaxID=63383 RepID=A0AAJ4XHW0_9BASI|nr:putative protein [Melanopsichium pennsylvanicum 4]SNX82390.1 uncharacterized protein MEPE_01096 [Melanopsichium pennsylvanicum]
MRSQNLAKALLRNTLRASSNAAPRMASVIVHPTSSVMTFVNCVNSARTFSTSGVSLKKKNKKDPFAAASSTFEQEHDHTEEFAIENDDDLFGGMSDTTETLAASSSTSTSAMSRVEFAVALEAYRASLSWECIDRGRFPPLSRWRYLASHADTQSELEQVLELAKLYRDRVGSLGVNSGREFASRARWVKLPEIALNAFLDRYTYGLEFDQEALYLVMSGLMRKINRRDREEILASAELPGAPVQESDLLGMVVNEAAESAVTQEGEDVAEKSGVGKAEVISKRHELDMPLARAKLSIIDRMSLLLTLSTSNPNPILLSYLPYAYITTFHLVSNRHARSNPLLTKIHQRLDNLISLLTISAQNYLVSNSTPTSTTTLTTTITNRSTSKNNAIEVPLLTQRSMELAQRLTCTLWYVAKRGQTGFVDIHRKGNIGKNLDVVKTLYRLMDTVDGATDKRASASLVMKVEPKLQSSI